MSRYTGPSWKVSRRLGFSLSGTGKELSRRPYAPGQHGQDRRGSLSEYGLQLREKQKLRGDNFMILLERRLDNVVYRLGLASTRRQARQLVNHGHITVDGKRVDIPSYEVEPGQVISLRERSKDLQIVKEALEAVVGRVPFVNFDENKMEGTLVRLPDREELDANIDEALVVEFYNR